MDAYLIYEEPNEKPSVVRAVDVEEALSRYAWATGGRLSRIKAQEDGSCNAVIAGGASPTCIRNGETRMPHSIAAVEAALFVD